MGIPTTESRWGYGRRSAAAAGVNPGPHRGGEGTTVGTGSVERSWCVVVPHHATGARLARHRLADELADVVPPTLLPAWVAALAERVGTAVRHADPLPGGVVRVAWRLRSA